MLALAKGRRARPHAEPGTSSHPGRRGASRSGASPHPGHGHTRNGQGALGNYLAEERGFVHLDLDRGSARAQFLRSGEEGLRTELAALAASERKLVVTWTFASETQLAYVEVMQGLGFEWIWTDSDRGAGYNTLIAQAATAREPRFVDAFEPDGRFRSLESVTAELRRRRPIPLPMPTKVRVPSVSRMRPVWAAWLRSPSRRRLPAVPTSRACSTPRNPRALQSHIKCNPGSFR